MLYNWISFFTTAAEAAASLIGLLFVTVSVGAGLSKQSIEKGTKAFLTPTLIHFVSVIFLSLAALAPWSVFLPEGVVFGVAGLTGIAYQVGVILFRKGAEMNTFDGVEMVMHTALPLLGYAATIAGSVVLILGQGFGLAVVASSIAALLLAGIYGAWDLTLWIVKNRGSDKG